jgi:hypothetical protein
MNVDNIIVKIIDKFTNTRVLVEEHTQVSAPKLIYNGSDDKYQSIMASEFHFNLLVRNNADGYFFHLYTGNERRYYVTVEDQDEELLFEGWLLPDFYEEPYTNAVMFVNLVATDGIASLKNVHLENNDYQREISVIELISICLKKTGLQKAIFFAPAIESAATDYKWHEIAVNCESYLDGEIKYVDGFFLNAGNVIFPKRKNCYEILDLLLVSLGCTFYGYGGIWFIEGINRKHQTNQLVDIYDYEGIFITTTMSIKQVVSLHNSFNTTPTVTVVSPWKKINASWDIKEDGNLVPKWAVTDPRTLTLFEAPKKNPFDFWKTNGSAMQVKVAPKGYRGNFNFWENTGSFEKPNVLRVEYYTSNTGEALSTVNNRSLSIKNRKYLKISDEYLTRTLKIEIELQAIDGLPIVIPNGTVVDSQDFFVNFFKTNIKIDDLIVVTTRVNADSPVELIKYDVTQMQLNVTPNGASALLKADITAKLEFEEKSIPENGFFDLTLHAAVHPNPSSQFFYGYNVNNITAFYTEQDTWEDILERNIDFSTSYDLDFFHGDSIQDLSERQWRFRRYIPQPPISGLINVLGSSEYEISYGLGTSNVTFWDFVIDYASAQLIINNPNLLQWNLPSPEGVKNISEILGPIGSFIWNVQQDYSGVWILKFLPNTYMLNLGFNYFKTKPLSVNLDSTQPFFGWVIENNEWRESWKRVGQNESIRYGVALAKIYHDAQSGPIIKIEGTALKLISPRELIHFKYMGDKNFIPARIELDFSEGKTNLLMLESKYQIVTDYVN